MLPKVSILMPVKDATPYLISCLDSIVNQSFQNWELIAVDDHSIDTSPNVLNQYSQQDVRIQLFPLSKDSGIIHALRQALKISRGKYITRMDADDLMSRDKLSLMTELLDEYGSGHVVTGKIKYFKDGGLSDGYKKYESWINQLMTCGNHWHHIYKECVIPSPSWMMSRKDLINIGAYDADTYPEDYDLCFRMKAAGLKVIATDSVLHYWRDYSDRTSRTSVNYKDNRFLELKVSNFIQQDYNADRTLYLWGAGKKGKQIAQLLDQNGIPFLWCTNNPFKIGRKINNHNLRSEETLFSSPYATVIIAFANPDEQTHAQNQLTKRPQDEQHQFFFFC